MGRYGTADSPHPQGVAPEPGKWHVSVRLGERGFQLFTQRAFTIEDAIAATKHEAAQRFGMRQSDVRVTKAELL